MKPLRQLAFLAISGGLPVFAAEGPAYLDVSPFLPPAGTAGTQGSAEGADVLELRGVMSGSSGTFFCVYDPVKKESAWVGRNGTDSKFTIIDGNASEGYLKIRMNDGRVLQLKLREAK